MVPTYCLHRFLMLSLVFWLILAPPSFGQETDQFERISLESELSHGTVYSILQDHTGFMWFGTEGGLNRYDGYGFITYFHDPQDSLSLSNSNISAMAEDSAGFIWLATWGGGLERFDPSSESFKHYRHNETRPGSISDDRVQTLYVDPKGTLWIGTYSGGLNRYDPEEDQFEVFKNNPADNATLSNNRVWTILQDSIFLYVGTTNGLNRMRVDRPMAGFERIFSNSSNPSTLSHSFIRSLTKTRRGDFWIGTQDGLNAFDPVTLKSKRFLPKGLHREGLSQGVINVVAEDSSGRLWIGTVEGGLNRFDPITGEWKHFVNVRDQVHSLSHNDVRAIYLDRSKNLWVGTRGGGINKMNLKPGKFITLSNDPTNPNSLVDNRVWSIFEEAESRVVWIATEKGLSRWDQRTGNFINYVNRPDNPNSLSNDATRSVVVGPDRSVWVATSGGGISRLNPSTGTWTTYLRESSRPGSLRENRVRALFVDSAGTLWAGTYKGLCRLDPPYERFIVYEHLEDDPQSLSHNEIRCITPDSGGILWVGTYGGGVNRFDPRTGRSTVYRVIPGKQGSLSSNDILSITVDRHRGVVWIGTEGSGLNCLDPKTGLIKVLSMGDGLPNNTILGIVIDGWGRLWISTNRGLARYSPQLSETGIDVNTTGAFRNYDVRDGLQGNFFVPGSFFKSTSGLIYFGGIGGLNVFSPLDIQDNPFIPPIVITDFRKFDQSVRIGRSLSSGGGIKLSYKDNFFAISFAALDFTKSAKNKFAYKLEGFDRDWNVLSDRHDASYTNVDPGEYTFRVIGTNNDGLWNADGASLEITIVPPLWKRTWFISIMTIAGFLLIAAGYRWRVRTMELQKHRLQEEVAVRTKELQRSRDEMARINEIVRIINAEHDFNSMLQSMLAITRHIQDVEKASAMVFNKEEEVFRFVAAAGHSMEYLEDVRMTHEEAEARYISKSECVHDDIFVARHAQRLPVAEKFTSDVIPEAMLIMRVRVDNEVTGYLIFDNMGNTAAFEKEDLGLLISLKEHFNNAFIKTQITENLRLLNDKKNEFLGIAAHDLRSPLSMMIGYLRLTLEDLESNLFDQVQLTSDLETMLRTAENMNHLISELLDISAIESGNVGLELQPVTLSSVVMDRENIHRRTAAVKKITMEVDSENLDQTVIVDPMRLSDVIDNLIINALKFTHEGGRVRIYGERSESEAILHVEDNGQGLTEEDMQHAFTSFRRLSAKPTAGEASTGLGLAIVKKVVEMHGGRVWVKSSKGQGACFSFSIPLATA